MYYGNNAPCFKCEHFCLNNHDGLSCGCRAFPKGIPYDFNCSKHLTVVEGQVGDFVFKELKKDATTPFREYEAFVKNKR